MKRICILVLILLLLVGCQKTPEQPLIVPKEQQVMVEKATATQAPETASSARQRASVCASGASTVP